MTSRIQYPEMMANNNDAYMENIGRAVLNHPHRLAFWQKDEYTHNIYLEGAERPYSSEPSKYDYGADNFSFNEAHLAQWVIPEKILVLIPLDLRKKVKVWSQAGAAVYTSLDRIGLTYKKAMSYAYPRLPSNLRKPTVCRTSGQSAVAGAETPPVSGAATPATSFESHPGKTTLITSFPQQFRGLTVGMESPPYSACDSGIGSPEIVPEDYEGVLPDLAFHYSELSGLPTTQGPLIPMNAEFSVIEWDIFIKKYNNELQDVRDCMKLFKGYGKVVEILRLEYELNGVGSATKDLATFTDWWNSMKSKVSECDSRVGSWDKPDLARIKHEYEIFRTKSTGEPTNYVLDRR